MLIFLSSYLASAYIFSGLICWLSFIRNFNQSDLRLQKFITMLLSLVILVSWPMWIIIEVNKLASLNTEVVLQADVNSKLIVSSRVVSGFN